jgi:hypothetical protein
MPVPNGRNPHQQDRQPVLRKHHFQVRGDEGRAVVELIEHVKQRRPDECRSRGALRRRVPRQAEQVVAFVE